MGISLTHVPAGQEVDIPTRESALEQKILGEIPAPTNSLPGLFVATANGLKGDGTTDDAPALAALVATMSNSGTIYFTPFKTYRLATPVTLPLGICLWMPLGGLLQPDAVTITVKCAIQAGLWQIFSPVNGGLIQFQATNVEAGLRRVIAVEGIYPEWWGAQAIGTHDDTAAIQAAINATTGLPLTPATTRRFAGPPVQLSAGVYRITDKLFAEDVAGLCIRGKGRYNTTITFDPNNPSTTYGVSSATSTSLAVAANSWTAHQFNSGFWWAYVYQGTGAGQWAQITDNTVNGLTLGAALTTVPDVTSRFVVAINAVLDLDGVLGPEIEHFCVTVNSSCYARHGIKYYRNADRSAGGSTQGLFRDVLVTNNYVDSGWQFGSKDLPRETNWQSDLCKLYDCQAIGRGISTGVFASQVGFRFGDAQFDNVLNYNAFGCDSISHAYNVVVSATNVKWSGGTAQSAFKADFLLNGGVQGWFTLENNRSELSAMLLDTSSPYGNTFSWTVVIRDCDTFLDGFVGNRLINYNLSAGTLRVEGVRTVPVPLRGTATGGTANTLSDSSQNWNTATVTYADSETATGKQGWDLRIIGGTGNGQRRGVLSNTSTTLTVDEPWDVIPDATTRYILMPRTPVAVNQGVRLKLTDCTFPGTPLEKAVMLGAAADVFTAKIEGYSETDDQAAITFGSAVVQGGVVYVQGGRATPAPIGFLNLAEGSGVDALLARCEDGAITSPNFTAGSLKITPLGKPQGQAGKRGIANTGTTQHKYKIVLRDGKGNPSVPSDTFTTTADCSAVLDAQGNAYISISPLAGTLQPNCASVDILKDDGTGTFWFIANCPAWRFGQFYDVGQPFQAYTLPVTDGTGTFAHQGALAGLYGSTPVPQAAAIASPSSDSVGTKAAIDAIRAALQNLGITA